jgi:CubicO group peptidase (beta-lactamase class C family)
MEFAGSRLERIHRVLSGYVERGEMPGLVALVSRHADVHVEALGTMSFGQAAPMKRDTIFRIASITKPLAAAAAMILVEECRLRLDESIEPWLPELAHRRVLKTLASPPGDTVPALRAITVRDLLTYRMGFGSPVPSKAPGTEEWMRRLGSLPLIAQPGERWMYQVSGDVLGVLVARVSGQSLGTFMRERIFEPLGMKDTAFHVPPGKLGRLPGCYVFNPRTGTLDVFDDPADSAWAPEPPFESGGGLVSTADDCLSFYRMMLNKGRHGRERILSRAAVELMTTDHLTPEQRAGSEVFFGASSSWGFGMAVDIRRTDLFRTPGRFGWDGGLGTSAYADPAEGMIGILMTQRLMASPEPPSVFTDFWTLAYAAME